MKKLRADWTQRIPTSIKPTMVFCSFLSKNIQIKIHSSIILAAVFYECETWSLTWRKLHRLKVFENRVLGKISGPKRDRVTGEWRRHDLYSSPNINHVIKSRRMTWAGHVACGTLHLPWRCILERRDAYRVLVGNLRVDNLCVVTVLTEI